jgi:hypothetical protein
MHWQVHWPVKARPAISHEPAIDELGSSIDVKNESKIVKTNFAHFAMKVS